MIYSTKSEELCSICQELPYVGKITKTSVHSGDFIVTVGKVLSACGHAFHPDCIHRAIHSGAINCPNCRMAIDHNDRSFTWMKDPIQPKGWERYISNEKEVNTTFICSEESSESEKFYIMKNVENLRNNKPVPGFKIEEEETLSFSLKGRVQVKKDESRDL